MRSSSGLHNRRNIGLEKIILHVPPIPKIIRMFAYDMKKKRHYILVDAEYAESVAVRLRAHYAKVLGREMPLLDLADWLTCCALDCGLQQGENEIEVCIFHKPEKERMDNFNPSDLKTELDKQGFDIPGLADFTVNCVAKEDIVEGAPLPIQAALFILHDKGQGAITLIANAGEYIQDLQQAATEAPGHPFTIMDMEQKMGTPGHVVLGFSMVHAMGLSQQDLQRE